MNRGQPTLAIACGVANHPIPVVANTPENRSPLAIAAEWASRIMTVSLEMVLPGVIGVWLDGRLGTKLVFALLGFGGGMVLGVWHLLQMLKPRPNKDPG
jgi:hypothetical protein